MKRIVILSSIFLFVSVQNIAAQNSSRKDPIIEKLKASFSSDETTYNDFKESLEIANIAYFGEHHKKKNDDQDLTEIFRTLIIPILISLKYNTFYLEELPYFKSPKYATFYEGLFDPRKEFRELNQYYFREIAESKELVQDLIDKKIKLFGYGIDPSVDDVKKMTSYDKIKLMADRAVEAADNELKKMAPLKMVLYGGALHNNPDIPDEEEVIGEWFSGKKIKELAKDKKYLSVDIISFAFLDQKIDAETWRVDLFHKLLLRYKSSIQNIEKQARKSKLPTLVKMQSTDEAKTYCDYLILVP